MAKNGCKFIQIKSVNEFYNLHKMHLFLRADSIVTNIYDNDIA